MSYFRKLAEQMATLLELMAKEDRWLILINADPDALASSVALKRIIGRRVKQVAIGQINVISRPDNLAMVKYLRIPSHEMSREQMQGFDRYALVDSQPHHNPEFEGIDFDVIIDHHPLVPDAPPKGRYVEVKPEYGANSTILVEYLYNLKIKPSRLLATALLYGIKSDTQDFERDFCDADVKAFRYLNKFADHSILSKIVRSEYHLTWLKHFGIAFRNMTLLLRGGVFCFMGKVDNPDILVILADFFLRVHELNWTAIGGVYDDTLICIFRGDGVTLDMGARAKELFDEVGSAGGHKAAARAEIPLTALNGENPAEFLLDKLDPKGKRRRPPRQILKGMCT